MKVIEALKRIKDLQRKASDLRDLVKNNCAISSIENPRYDNQSEKVRGWIQAHSDILKEILRLRLAIQKTNMLTNVDIEIGGIVASKSIAGWIHRRRDLANEELSMWIMLTDRNIREGQTNGPSGEVINIKTVRFFSPDERDNKKSLFQSEPMTIDSKLEVVNAITDLIED